MTQIFESLNRCAPSQIFGETLFRNKRSRLTRRGATTRGSGGGYGCTEGRRQQLPQVRCWTGAAGKRRERPRDADSLRRRQIQMRQVQAALIFDSGSTHKYTMTSDDHHSLRISRSFCESNRLHGPRRRASSAAILFPTFFSTRYDEGM